MLVSLRVKPSDKTITEMCVGSPLLVVRARPAWRDAAPV